jgi:putative membrane protein
VISIATGRGIRKRVSFQGAVDETDLFMGIHQGFAVHRKYQLALLVVTCLLLAASFIGAPYLQDQPLHHVPTVGALVVLTWLAWKARMSDASLTAIVLFIWLHILGARYIYSFVPYDEWIRRWLGFSIDETCGFTRNHYDRLVHFFYGVLATVPQVEWLRKRWCFGNVTAHFFSFALVLAAGAVYEIFEWLLAVVMAPEWAERYNGQQGDFFDPQKDLFCAAAGALIASAVMMSCSRRAK